METSSRGTPQTLDVEPQDVASGSWWKSAPGMQQALEELGAAGPGADADAP